MPITVRDIAWLAGLLEGEGCFTITKGSPVICLTMTDFDIVERAAQLVGATNTTSRYINKPRHKPQARWSIGGSVAIQWALTIYPFMGVRRKGRIRQLVGLWTNSRAYRRLVVCGHSERKHFGSGLCRQCYAKQYYKQNTATIHAKNSANYFKHHAARRAQQTAYRIRKKMEAAS